MVIRLWCVVLALSGLMLSLRPADGQESTDLPRLLSGSTVSALDGETQQLVYWAPESATSRPTVLFVFVHSWSGDYTQDNSKWLQAAVDRGWIYLHPNFRGINHAPKACGSKFARQDVLDAVQFIRERYRVADDQVYLAGVSGGGHMSMLMAGHHPEAFSAVSAWVGPADLASWYQFHTVDGKPQRYAQMVAACMGGAPGDSDEVDAEYRDRSPVFHTHRCGDLPVSIWAGVRDGHAGSVPISHSLRAFNGIALSQQAPLISEIEIEQLTHEQRLQSPTASDVEGDATLGREILLRRRAGPSMITIFDGGHESLPDAACAWLAQQRRRVVPADRVSP